MKEERKKKNPIIFICPSHQVQRKMQTGETVAVNSLYFPWKIVYLFTACRNYLFAGGGGGGEEYIYIYIHSA